MFPNQVRTTFDNEVVAIGTQNDGQVIAVLRNINNTGMDVNHAIASNINPTSGSPGRVWFGLSRRTALYHFNRAMGG